MPLLTDEQARALDPHSSFWIHASAGSGKTSVLTQRVMRILIEGGAPQEILCLTFTKKAAQEMMDRIQFQCERWSDLNEAELRKDLDQIVGITCTKDHIKRARHLWSMMQKDVLQIQTFHSFCHRMLVLFPAESGMGNGFALLESHHAASLWDKAFDHVVDQCRDTNHPLHKVVQRISSAELYMDDFFKKMFLSRLNGASIVQDLSCQDQKDYHRLFCAVTRHYDHIKGDHLDMDDLLIKALDLFQDEDFSGWVMHSMNMHFRHLFLDEAQDTSPTQWGIFRYLVESVISDGRRTVFVVGDPKQSIYGFQGANLDDFFAMKNFVHQWVLSQGGAFQNVSLNLSFRSCAPIIHAVNYTFECDHLLSTPFERHTAFDDQRPGCAHFLLMHENDNPYDFWVNRIKDWLKEPFFLPSQNRHLQKKDVMILLPRRTSFFLNLQQSLLEHQLITPLSFSMESNEILAVLVSLGRWILDYHDDQALSVILQTCFSERWKDIVFCASYDRQKRSIWSHICFLSKTQDVWQPIVQTLQEWINAAQNFSMTEWYAHVIWGKKGIGSWSYKDGDVMDTIDVFFHALDQHLSGGEFSDFIHSVSQDQGILKGPMHNHEGIQLMTIHGAKGLQSPVVIMPDVPPPFRKETSEYWRLLYVAMTRAQDRLYMMACKEQKGWMPILKKAFQDKTNLDTTDQDTHPRSAVQACEEVIDDTGDHSEWMHNLPVHHDCAVQSTKSNSPIHFSDLKLKIWGTALHQLLDEMPPIDPKHWFDHGLSFLMKKGMCRDRAQQWSEQLMSLLHRDDLRPLFFHALSERTFVTPQGLVRPDRILLNEHSLWIVDFKSALTQDTPSVFVQKQYAAQMVRYGCAVGDLYPHRSVRLSILWLATGVLEDIAMPLNPS